MGPGHQDLGSNCSYATVIKVAMYNTAQPILPFLQSGRVTPGLHAQNHTSAFGTRGNHVISSPDTMVFICYIYLKLSWQ